MDEEFFKLHVDAGHMNERRRSFITRLYSTLGDESTLSADAMAAFRLSSVVLRTIMVHGSAWLSRSHGYARQEPPASALAGGSDGTSWLSVAASWLLG